jgi:hypothetical protein
MLVVRLGAPSRQFTAGDAWVPDRPFDMIAVSFRRDLGDQQRGSEPERLRHPTV